MTLSGEVALLAVSSAIMPQCRWKARLRAYAIVMYASSISARLTSRYTAVAATATPAVRPRLRISGRRRETAVAIRGRPRA